MGGACSTHGRHEECIQNFGRETCWEETVTTRRRWKDNIRMDVREIGLEGVDWIHLA